jgi:two-component system CheB/CheR fusion protein
MPYRTLDDKIDGVVITFFNISDLKEVEVKLNETEQMNRLLLNSSSDVIIRLSANFKIVELNPEAEKYFGKKQEEIINKNYIHVFIPEMLRKKTESEMLRILKKSQDTKLKMQLITTGGKLIENEWSVLVLTDNLKEPSGMLLSIKK